MSIRITEGDLVRKLKERIDEMDYDELESIVGDQFGCRIDYMGDGQFDVIPETTYAGAFGWPEMHLTASITLSGFAGKQNQTVVENQLANAISEAIPRIYSGHVAYKVKVRSANSEGSPGIDGPKLYYVIHSDEGFWSNDEGWVKFLEMASLYTYREWVEMKDRLPHGENVRWIRVTLSEMENMT